MENITRLRLLFIILASLLISCGNKKKDEHAGHELQKEPEVYTCPMHPEIIRNAPGTCPICGMRLVKKETGSAAVQEVGLETLLKPANEFVVSGISVTSIEQREEEIELNVVGTVAYDTRQAGAISSRVKGRIERLYIRYKYQPVKKGQRIMDIYSPELVTAQQNLLFLLGNDPDNTLLINAAKDRLQLMGMTGNQVAELVLTKTPKYAVTVFSNYSGFVTDLVTLPTTSPIDDMKTQTISNQELNIKEGMYVQAGQTIFSVYNPGRAWVLLDVFPELQNMVRSGDAVRIVPETAPHQNFRAKIDYIEPVFRAGSKTLSARVYFNNAVMQVPIGSRVTATIFASAKNATWLPKDAVLTLGRGRIVFRKETGGFRAHEIKTGIELNGLVEVISGLSPTDSVASNAHYLVDNEAFIKISEQ